MAENLVLGRGRIFFAPYAQNTTVGGEPQYLGNTPTLTMASANTKLDHYSSEQGLKVKDRSVLLQTDITLTFDTDNISVANLMLWFGGKNTGTAPADAPAALGTLALIGSAAQIFGSLLFLSDNPVGNNLNYWFPYVSIAPNGNYALKGDAWQTLSFTAEALKRDITTDRFYAYTPPNGLSNAASFQPTYLTPENVGAATGGDTVATAATITAPASETAGSSVNITYANTGGTESFLSYHNGTTNVGPIIPATGASGTIQMTAPAAGTYTVKAYGNSAGTGTALGTSASITIT